MKNISHLFKNNGKPIIFKLPNELNEKIKKQYKQRILVYY